MTQGANSVATVGEGDLAREALLVLADDPDNRQGLTALIEGLPAQDFLDPITIGVAVAALIALQTHVEFEWTKDGKIHLKIEKKPLPVELMRKLLAFFSQKKAPDQESLVHQGRPAWVTETGRQPYSASDPPHGKPLGRKGLPTSPPLEFTLERVFPSCSPFPGGSEWRKQKTKAR